MLVWIFDWEGSTKILSIFRPDYGSNYRDLYFWDFRDKRVKNVIKKWKCNNNIFSNKTVANVADYFTVDLLNSYLIEPVFYKNYIYFNSGYPVKLFSVDKKEEIDNQLFKWENMQKNEQWFLNRYKFD